MTTLNSFKPVRIKMVSRVVKVIAPIICLITVIVIIVVIVVTTTGGDKIEDTGTPTLYTHKNKPLPNIINLFQIYTAQDQSNTIKHQRQIKNKKIYAL